MCNGAPGGFRRSIVTLFMCISRRTLSGPAGCAAVMEGVDSTASPSTLFSATARKIEDE